MTDDAVTDDKCSFAHVEATQATFSGAEEAQQYTATSDEILKMNISDLNEGDGTSHLMALAAASMNLKTTPEKRAMEQLRKIVWSIMF